LPRSRTRSSWAAVGTRRAAIKQRVRRLRRPPPRPPRLQRRTLAPSPRILGFSGSTNGRFFVEVFAPWLPDGGEPAHADTELLFFVKAWASRHPQFKATLVDAR